jgi:release factor glutamine methyltransferase
LATGSGCVAIAIAAERAAARVTASDRAPEAIEIARENARALRVANVEFRTGDWFDAVRGERFAVIVANPPYVAAGDAHLAEGDLRFEPRAALVGGADGLDCIRRIVGDAPRHLERGGWLAIEHGYDQAAACRQLLKAAGFSSVASRRDIAGHERVTAARHA